MTRLIILVFALGSFIIAHSQCDLPYKSLSEFENDTTEFMMHNFLLRADCYEGKTLGDVVNDLGISISMYVPGNDERRSDFYNRLSIYIVTNTWIEELKKTSLEIYYAFI